jgi:hypothetical protein
MTVRVLAFGAINLVVLSSVAKPCSVSGIPSPQDLIRTANLIVGLQPPITLFLQFSKAS